jgi:hypothetical protein
MESQDLLGKVIGCIGKQNDCYERQLLPEIANG